MNTDSNSELQAPSSLLIYSYTRAQAIADGVQVEVLELALAGVKRNRHCPV